jgi:hypothetical protein
MTGSVPVVARPADGAAVPATEGVGRPVADAPVGGSKRLGLSLTQIAGGALAAVTAAVAASYLGVAGTLIGAGLGSVVSSVAAALYSTSLSRAARASKVLVVRPAGSGTGPLEASAQDPAAVPPELPPEPLAGPAGRQWWRNLRWGPVAAVAGVLFVAAMAVVNLSELAIGHPLGNSATSGTTLTNLGGSTPTTPSPSGTAPAASPTGTPSPTESGAQASPTPSATENSTGRSSPTSSPGASTTETPTSSSTTSTATTTTTGTGTTAPAPTAPPPTPGG